MLYRVVQTGRHGEITRCCQRRRQHEHRAKKQLGEKPHCSLRFSPRPGGHRADSRCGTRSGSAHSSPVFCADAGCGCPVSGSRPGTPRPTLSHRGSTGERHISIADQGGQQIKLLHGQYYRRSGLSTVRDSRSSFYIAAGEHPGRPPRPAEHGLHQATSSPIWKGLTR